MLRLVTAHPVKDIAVGSYRLAYFRTGGDRIGAARLRPASLRRQSLPRSTFDHCGSLFGNHDRRRVAVVEVTAGITEASMTRSPSSPCTRSSLSTTLVECEPIMQVQLA